MQRPPGNVNHISGAPLYTDRVPGRNTAAPPAPPPRSSSSGIAGAGLGGGRISPGHPPRNTAPMAVPDQFSPSEPGPATVYPGSNLQQKTVYMRSSPSAERSLASDAKYPTTQALITDKGKTVPNLPPVPPQPVGAKRSSSQGSLNKQSRGTRTTEPTAAPQVQPRYPLSHMNGGEDNAAVHGPPHKVQTVVKYKESGYSSSSTSGSSGVPLTEVRTAAAPGPRHQAYAPPSASVKTLPASELDNVPGAVRRPMSFVKAVELSDALASQEREREKQQLQGQKQHGRTPPSQGPSLATTSEERHNLYGSTYEISV